ncbi:DUF2809 domain-containing protein [Streptacidiphilus cavernicola]|uniref:DUF2809 domain-containing protein n=1 Tax=Streptacidiphilus cavernicola TaxID=3342716 RepID=A0ABV6W5K7_9ACTN
MPLTRGRAAVAVAGTVAVGLVAPGLVGAWTGGVLYTLLLWTLVLLAAPRTRPAVAAAVALAVSWAVEFSQLSPYSAELARHSRLARLALGSTFDVADLPWYALGAAVAFLLHTWWNGAAAEPAAAEPAAN